MTGALRDPTIDWADFVRSCEARLQQPVHVPTVHRPVLVFGAGAFGRAACEALQALGFEVSGYIETQPRQAVLDHLPVLSWQQAQQVMPGAQLVIGIFNRGAPLSQLRALAIGAGFKDVFLPWDIYGLLREHLGWRYWLEASDYLANHLQALEATYWALDDATSRVCLLNLCRFRMGLQLDYAEFAHPERQYFNAITLPALGGRPSVYVDGGAYNGDTLLDFAAGHPIHAAYLFEPGIQNFARLVAQCKGLGWPVICLPLALSSGYEMLAFHDGNGEAGAIGRTGGSTIAAAALDDVLGHQRVDFIKLDVEGAEIAALDGAATIIARHRPVLALSLYHHPHDLWAIPAKVLSLCSDYRLFVRQHFANSFDTVLYAVPREVASE